MTTLDSILVRFDPDSDWREARWLVCDADGALGSERRDALETIAAECAGRPIIGLLPGAVVLATRAALPRASRNKRLQALPYALEDQLAADPETLHFALGRERDDGSCEVEIVARELIESVLARCRSAELTLAALHADAACIAPKPGDLQVWIDGDDMHVRHPDGRRQTLPAQDLLAAVRLTGIETQTDGVLGLRVYGDAIEAPTTLATLDVAGGDRIFAARHRAPSLGSPDSERLPRRSICYKARLQYRVVGPPSIGHVGAPRPWPPARSP
jgi:type II secretion system protein L